MVGFNSFAFQVGAFAAGLVFSSPENNSENFKESEWDTTFNVNTKGVFLCCQVGPQSAQLVFIRARARLKRK